VKTDFGYVYSDVYILRKILFAVAFLIVTIIIGGSYLFHRIDSKLARDNGEKLKKLEPRVITGAGQFNKSTFYRGEALGEVVEIRVGFRENAPSLERN
jgi:hypothetical protein